MGYASVPPSLITDWSQLPPFPPGCTPGLPISKTTVRIPQAWRDRKHEYVMRLASFVLSYTYNLYEHTALTAFARTPDACLGIAKQCGNQVAIHWFEFTIDGGLVQVATRKSVYESRHLLFQPLMPAAARTMMAEMPSSRSELKAAHERHTAEVTKAVNRYWTSWRTAKMVGHTTWQTIRGIGAALVPTLFCSGCFVGMLQFVVQKITDTTEDEAQQLSIRIAVCLVAFFLLVSPPIVFFDSMSESKKADISRFRDDQPWSLSFLYFQSSVRTEELAMQSLGKSHDQQVFDERMGGVLKELQAYAENQE